MVATPRSPVVSLRPISLRNSQGMVGARSNVGRNGSQSRAIGYGVGCMISCPALRPAWPVPYYLRYGSHARLSQGEHVALLMHRHPPSRSPVASKAARCAGRRWESAPSRDVGEAANDRQAREAVGSNWIELTVPPALRCTSARSFARRNSSHRNGQPRVPTGEFDDSWNKIASRRLATPV